MRKSYRKALERLAEKRNSVDLEIIDFAGTVWQEIGPDVMASFAVDSEKVTIDRVDVVECVCEMMCNSSEMSEDAKEHFDSLTWDEMRNLVGEAFPYETYIGQRKGK
jgi:hypothetical protein